MGTRFIIPSICNQCGFAIETGKRKCEDCKKQNRKDKALTDKYEGDSWESNHKKRSVHDQAVANATGGQGATV